MSRQVLVSLISVLKKDLVYFIHITHQIILASIKTHRKRFNFHVSWLAISALLWGLKQNMQFFLLFEMELLKGCVFLALFGEATSLFINAISPPKSSVNTSHQWLVPTYRFLPALNLMKGYQWLRAAGMVGLLLSMCTLTHKYPSMDVYIYVQTKCCGWHELFSHGWNIDCFW